MRRPTLASKIALGLAATSCLLTACPPTLAPRPEPGQIHVETSPPGAEVLVDGETRGPAPITFSARSRANGAEVTVRLAGYREWRRRLAILPDAALTIQVPLKPAAGTTEEEARLLIDTAPPARVHLDGEETSAHTPLDALTALPLSIGSHVIDLETDDGALYRYRVEIANPGLSTVTLTPLGSPAAGSAVTSFVRCWGCREPVRSGTPRSKLPALGADPTPELVAPTTPEAAALGPAETEAAEAPAADALPRLGTLVVDSDPPGASVELDGAARGQTPLSIEGLEATRSYRVGLNLEGYLEWKGIVNLGDEDRKVVDVRLKPSSDTAAEAPAAAVAPAAAEEPAAVGGAPADVAEAPSAPAEKPDLAINTTPTAIVIVDGKETGRRTPLWPGNGLRLAPGFHQLTFVADSGKRYTYEVTIPKKSGRRLSLVCDLGKAPRGSVEARLIK